MSLASVLQKDASGEPAEIVWLTHRTQEADPESVSVCMTLQDVHEISVCIRVEGKGRDSRSHTGAAPVSSKPIASSCR